MHETLTVRDPRVDVAKGLLIFLVVVGHFLEVVSGWTDPLIRFMLTMTYMFHMPAFVFLAGLTSKPRNIGRRIGTFAIWMVSFQALYAAAFLVLGKSPDFLTLTPYWTLWFLLAMMFWTAAVPSIVRFKRAAVPVAVLLSIGCGLVPFVGYPLTLSRAFIFLPFFVIGVLYGKDIVAFAPRISRIAKGTLVVISLTAGGGLYMIEIGNQWLYGSFNFEAIGVLPWVGIVGRLGLLLVAGVVIFTFLSVIPSTSRVAERSGRASLSIYLFHGFVVLAAGRFLPEIHASGGTVAAVLVCLALSLLTVALFSTPVFETAIRWIPKITIDPIAAKMSRKQLL